MRLRSGLLLALLLGTGHQVTADILYTVTDLGILGSGINNAGQVTGRTNTSSTGHAVVYSNGQITDLGTVPGGIGSYGSDINDVGQVTGSAIFPGVFYHAFLYTDGQMRDLVSSSSDGNGINNAGQVTGGASLPPFGAIHAFLYSNGQMMDLGTLPGDIRSEGFGINNAGQVTGTSFSPSPLDVSHAFLYSNGQMRDLGTLGGPSSNGYGINDAGQVTGLSFTTPTGDGHAFLYSNGQMMDLGLLPGYSESQGVAINNVGQVVGVSYTRNGVPHPFLYSDGQMRNLEELIDPALGITFAYATGINDHGQIVAGRGDTTYLLTPTSAVPEPNTLALFGVALLGLGVWARTSKSSCQISPASGSR